MLSVITIEKLEKYKALSIVQKEYQTYLAEMDRYVFNQRQKKMYASDSTSQRQLSFRLFFNKKAREAHPEKMKQIRFILIELMKGLYSEAAFYKELEQKRPQFLDELLDDFIVAADRLTDKDKIRRIEDIRRVRLADPELQETFYHMLKGTVRKDQLEKSTPLTERNRQKTYLSLLHFLHIKDEQKISVQRSSRELLQAIFGREELVEAIIAKRNELDAQKDPQAGAQFAQEFKGKQKGGISDDLLDFRISSTDKTPYD